MQNENKKGLAVGVVGVLAIAALAVSLMAGSGSAASNEELTTSGGQSIRIAPAGEGPSKLAVLEQATPAAFEALPDGVQQIIAQQAAGSSDGKLGAIGTTTLGLGTLVTFAEIGDTLCFIQGQGDPGFTFGCSPLAEATAGRSYLAMPSPDGDGMVKVVGIAPNGIASLRIAGAEATEAPVSANVWTADLEPANTEVSATDTSGNVAYQFDLPLTSISHSIAEAG